MPRFPNFFTLLGPNTGLAHGGNAIFVTECQMRLVMTRMNRSSPVPPASTLAPSILVLA